MSAAVERALMRREEEKQESDRPPSAGDKLKPGDDKAKSKVSYLELYCRNT